MSVSGWWLRKNPSEKYESIWMTIPNIWKNKKMFQSPPNRWYIYINPNKSPFSYGFSMFFLWFPNQKPSKQQFGPSWYRLQWLQWVSEKSPTHRATWSNWEALGTSTSLVCSWKTYLGSSNIFNMSLEIEGVQLRYQCVVFFWHSQYLTNLLF